MLKYCETFDHVTLSALAALGWGGSTDEAIIAGGRADGNLLDINHSNSYLAPSCKFTLSRSCDRIVIGFAFWPKQDYYHHYPFIVQFLYGAYQNFMITVTPACAGTVLLSGLTFSFATGAGTGYPAIASSAYVSVPFIASAPTFVEILIDVTDYMNGQVKCGVNGKVVHNITGIETAAGTGFGNNPYDPRAKLNTVQFTGSLQLDGIYICDDDGGYHNDFLGDIFVKPLYPTSDGDQVSWDPYINGLAAPENTSRVTLIDDLIFDPAVEPDYIQCAQDLSQETMSFSQGTIKNVPVGSTLVAINHRTAARSVASPGTPPPSTLIPLFKSSGNDIIITNSLAKKFVGWTYQFLDVYYNLVPGLTVDWTELLVDESQFGFMLREAVWTGVELDEMNFADEVTVT